MPTYKLYYLLLLILYCLPFAGKAQLIHYPNSIKEIEGFDKMTDLKKADTLYHIAHGTPDPEKTFYFANASIGFAKKTNEYKYVSANYLVIGVAYRFKGDYKMALNYLFKAATVADSTKRKIPISAIYCEISNTYLELKEFDASLSYIYKANIGYLQTKDYVALANNYTIEADIWLEMNQLDKAMEALLDGKSMLDTLPKENGSTDYFKAYNSAIMGHVFLKKKDYKKAEDAFLKALDIMKAIGDDYGLAQYCPILGNLYSETNRLDKAIYYIEQGLVFAKKLNYKVQIRNAFLLLSELNVKKNNYKEALYNNTQYLIYKDSIENIENTKQIANLRTEYEVGLKQKEIKNLEKEKQVNRIYTIIVVLLLILAVMVLLFFRQRWKNTRLMAQNQLRQHADSINTLLKQQETRTLHSMIQGQENERKRLAKELHNHLGSLMATIKVNLNSIEKTDPELQNLTLLVDRACTDIRSLSHSMNMGISDNFGLVPALQELTEHLQQVNGLFISFSASMGEEPIGLENEIVIYRIVQELVSNVLKHANATRLNIQLLYIEDESLINIMVEDNGIGFKPEEFIKTSSGMGLKAIKELITQLNGTIEIDSHPLTGTTVIIDLNVIDFIIR